MIIPDHWAEARRQHQARRKPVTIRRFGWSEGSASEAQAMADARADEALARAMAGELINRRESKIAYNGADGLPIREEVLARHGDAVITRNSYGAHCLNSPNVLFADVDFDAPRRGLLTTAVAIALITLAGLLGWHFDLWLIAGGVALSALLFGSSIAGAIYSAYSRFNGGPEGRAMKRVHAAMSKRPGWSVRAYRTPAGLRLLATHQLFDPLSPEVQAFFTAVAADPVYVRMCKNQRCFRARLTAKPWRIGIDKHLRPRPGVWPVDPAQLPVRKAWVATYDKQAGGFAACRYLETLGPDDVHIDVMPTLDLHDQATRATSPSTLPLA